MLLKKGTLCKIIGNGSGHNYGPIGTTFKTVRRIEWDKDNHRSEPGLAGCHTNNIKHNEFVPAGITREQILKQIDDCKKEISALEEQLQVMKKYEMTEYDPKLITIHKVLVHIDNKKLSRAAKAIAINKLLNDLC